MATFDISGMLGNTGVALEQTAFNKFGAAVSNQATSAISGIFATPGSGAMLEQSAANAQKISTTAGLEASNNNAGWHPTPYASAITSGFGSYDPKNKFLFKVNIEFYGALGEIANSLGITSLSSLSRDLSFVVKQIDIPKYDFEYADVNLYNFRTKVLKRVIHQDLKFTFYDDTSNHALDFLNLYLMLINPLTRVSRLPETEFGDYGFADPAYYGGITSSMRSALGTNSANSLKGIIRRLTIGQYYLVRGEGGNPWGAYKVNVFEFTNPRLMHFDMGDHDHENGNTPASVNASFDFDSLHIQTGVSLSDPLVTDRFNSLSTGDLLDGVTPGQMSTASGPAKLAGNSRNPFLDIIATQGSRMIQNGIGSVLANSVGGIAGGALSPFTSSISSAVGNAADRTIGAVGGAISSGVQQGISLPTKPPVADNSQAPPPPTISS